MLPWQADARRDEFSIAVLSIDTDKAAAHFAQPNHFHVILLLRTIIESVRRRTERDLTCEKPILSTMSHSHDGASSGHGHTHEIYHGPGSYLDRELPIVAGRDFDDRTFTVGIGGPVGSGKTALMLELCLALQDEHNIAAVTNDIFTREDTEFLAKHRALTPERIIAIETRGCPHAAVQKDISANLLALQGLQAKFNTDLLLIGSGGDNLAANYSRELTDFIIYLIDVAGGDEVP